MFDSHKAAEKSHHRLEKEKHAAFLRLNMIDGRKKSAVTQTGGARIEPIRPASFGNHSTSVPSGHSVVDGQT